MSNQIITINTRQKFGTMQPGKAGLQQLVDHLAAVVSGNVQSDSVVWSRRDDNAVGAGAYSGPACGLLTLSGGAGSVGVTLDGNAITTAYAVSDAATMAAFALAFNAAAQPKGLAQANTRIARMTLASVLAGQSVSVFGQIFTAVTGTPTDFYSFDRSGTDTQTATNLSRAINRCPALQGVARAVSVVGVVHVALIPDRVPKTAEILANPSASTITINQAIPVAGASVMILCLTPGVVGNAITAVASGTGMTYASDRAGKLGGGTGGPTVNTVVAP